MNEGIKPKKGLFNKARGMFAAIGLGAMASTAACAPTEAPPSPITTESISSPASPEIVQKEETQEEKIARIEKIPAQERTRDEKETLVTAYDAKFYSENPLWQDKPNAKDLTYLGAVSVDNNWDANRKLYVYEKAGFVNGEWDITEKPISEDLTEALVSAKVPTTYTARYTLALFLSVHGIDAFPSTNGDSGTSYIGTADQNAKLAELVTLNKDLFLEEPSGLTPENVHRFKLH